MGVNAYSNFGTRTDFGSNYAGGEFGGETEILSVNFGVSGSYRIDSQWSIGAGLDLIYGQGTLKRSFRNDIYTGPVVDQTTGMLNALNGRSIVDIDKADGFGVGFNIGTVYELDENNRFGLSYRYSPTITAKDGDKEIKLPLPDMAEFSGYHRIDNTPLLSTIVCNTLVGVLLILWNLRTKISMKKIINGKTVGTTLLAVLTS